MRFNKAYDLFDEVINNNPDYIFDLRVVLVDMENPQSREILLASSIHVNTRSMRMGYIVPDTEDECVAVIYNDKVEARLLGEGLSSLEALGESADIIIEFAEFVNYLTWKNYRNIRSSILDKGGSVG